MGNPLRKIIIVILIASLIMSSNLAAAITLTDERPAVGLQTDPPQLDLVNLAYTDCFTADWSPSALAAYTEGAENVEIIIGLDGNPQSQTGVAAYAAQNGGRIINTLSMGSKSAVVVSIPVNAVASFVAAVQGSGLSRYVEINGECHVYSMPNDPYWNQQWGTQRIGADYAWNTTVGSEDLVVAVIDTGIDYYHTDLADCYIGGYDFVNDDPFPLDDNGHGTHCAGILAATMNNAEGIAGVAQVKIMALKGLGASGSGSFVALAQCLIYATDAGARILSNSWGSSNWGALTNGYLISDAIEYATSQGVLVLASAGNDNLNKNVFPAMDSNVVAVAATNRSDTKASFSNYGDWVDVAAPGVDIMSTFPTYQVTLNDRPGYETTRNYASFSGTSMACPMAAGVAALIWSTYPQMDAEAVRNHLEATCDDVGEVGFDIYFGHGIVNASRAVTQLPVQHDLVARSWIKPSCAMLNEAAAFTLTVANRGAQDETDAEVRLVVNDTVVDSTVIASLSCYTSSSIMLSWTPTETGTYNVTYIVTPSSGETDLSNNELSAVYTVVVSPSEDNWTLLANNTDSGVGCGLKEAYSQLDDGVVFLKVAFYRNWNIASQAIDAWVLIDSDQNSRTGIPLNAYPGQEDCLGVDYMILVGIEGNEILRWNTTERSWDSNSLQLLYLDAPNNTNTYVVGVAAEDIEVADSFDCSFVEVTVLFMPSYIWTYWNWMPTSGYVPFSPQRNQHDLAVTLETNNIYAPNASYTVTATVYNLGQSNESNVNLELFVDGQVVNSTTFPSISSSGYGKLTYAWNATKGYYNITAYAASVDDEATVQNNVRTRFVSVTPKIAVISDNDELWEILTILESMSVNYGYGYDNSHMRYTAYPDLLSQYPLIIYFNTHDISSTEKAVLNQYLANGGKLIVTGSNALANPEARLGEVVRGISSGDDINQPDLHVMNASHPIMNGPYGKFAQGYCVSDLNPDNDAVIADTAKNAVSIAKLADGKDKIIVTDNLPGTVIFWNGIAIEDWLYNPDCQAIFKNMLIWLLGSTGPSTTSDYDGAWHTTDFTINLSANSELGVVGTHYRINEAATRVVSLDGQPHITAESANNTLEYWSTDVYGYQEKHHYLTGIKLDKTAPTANVGDNQTITITEDNTVTFNGSGSTDNLGIVFYSWNFGSGTEVQGMTVNHTYNSTGTYTVTLTVADAAGNTDQASVTVYVIEKPSPTPAPTPTSMPTPTKSATTPTPTIKPTIAPTPMPTPTSAPNTIPVTVDNDQTVQLSISGNITATQITNATIHLNQTAATTTIRFRVTGESGTTGFGNLTVPKSQVPLGSSPVIYIDGEPAENQGFTEDANNYYVWYMVHFSTHELSIVFVGASVVNASADYTVWIALAVVALIVCVVAVLLFKRRSSAF
jgi:thermitase